MIDFDNLYLMGEGHMYGALHVRPLNDITDDSAILKGTTTPSKAIIFEHSSGGKPRDVIGTEYPCLLLFS